MADLGWLAVDGDGTNSIYMDGTYDSINDDPTSGQPDADYVENNDSEDFSSFFTLASVPADFDSMDTLTFEAYTDVTGTRTDDDIQCFIAVTASDESTLYTDEISIGLYDSGGVTEGLTQTSFTLTGDGENASESDWNGARVRLRWDYSQSKSSDGLTVRVHASRIGGTYTQEAAGPVSASPEHGRVLVVGYTPAIDLSPIEVSIEHARVLLKGYAPAVSQTAHQSAEVEHARVLIKGYAPSIDLSPIEASPEHGRVLVKGYVPTVYNSGDAPADQSAEPEHGRVLIKGYAPDIDLSPIEVSIEHSRVLVVGYAPTIAMSPIEVSPEHSRTLIVGYAPEVTATVEIEVEHGRILVVGYAPDISYNQSVTPEHSRVLVVGYVPTVYNSGDAAEEPATVAPSAWPATSLHPGNLTVGRRKSRRKRLEQEAEWENDMRDDDEVLVLLR